MYTKIVYAQTHIPRNNLIAAVLNLGHDEFNVYIGIFACGALAASISVGIVIPSTWFVYLYNILLA